MPTIDQTRNVNCAFSAAIEFAETALQHRSELHITPGSPAAISVDFQTKSTTDSTDEVRRHEALAFAWKPRYSMLFPYFTGVLIVRPNDGKTSLRLRGHYRPPFGFIGKAFDAVLGRFIARRTIHLLLFEIAADIETQWRVFARAPQAGEQTIAP